MNKFFYKLGYNRDNNPPSCYIDKHGDEYKAYRGVRLFIFHNLKKRNKNNELLLYYCLF
ncbi:hypothetical protein JUNP353_3920 [Elizabethkingia anophelis]|nr:hypothetical protein JUNP353_3920 [Elizabethkingia anophelis]